ncbi:hypothetical protein PoB_004976600 [Plakobranchus ocellatus]|uniref:Uncharacterized protein n=1 Tax=Plakobranchus ocellatus TaxID=259542 RepID=A0AAV4BIQ8_9GAST|nr:hypothetical protein PoB_004976600 [Plakobranchus ocellatus]
MSDPPSLQSASGGARNRNRKFSAEQMTGSQTNITGIPNPPFIGDYKVSILLFSLTELAAARTNLQYYFTSRGFSGTVDSELARPLCRGFEPRHRRPGLTEGLIARDHFFGLAIYKNQTHAFCFLFVEMSVPFHNKAAHALSFRKYPDPHKMAQQFERCSYRVLV